MNTRRYVVTRIGDQYVPVLQDSHPRISYAAQVSGGALLIYLATRHRGPFRMLLAVGGLSLIAHASHSLARFGPLKAPLQKLAELSPWLGGPSYHRDRHNRPNQTPADLVDEQVMQSFPASDPPSH